MIDIFALCQRIAEIKVKADTLDSIGEVTTEIVESDKVGYNWKVYKVNGIEVRKEYIENEIAKGTEVNPIYFVDGIEVKPNIFYYYDDKKWVYMGAEMVAENWESVSESMAEWYE